MPEALRLRSLKIYPSRNPRPRVEDIARARGPSIAALARDPIGHCAMLETVPFKKTGIGPALRCCAVLE
jgi:hypothetical protein